MINRHTQRRLITHIYLMSSSSQKRRRKRRLTTAQLVGEEEKTTKTGWGTRVTIDLSRVQGNPHDTVPRKLTRGIKCWGGKNSKINERDTFEKMRFFLIFLPLSPPFVFSLTAKMSKGRDTLKGNKEKLQRFSSRTVRVADCATFFVLFEDYNEPKTSFQNNTKKKIKSYDAYIPGFISDVFFFLIFKQTKHSWDSSSKLVINIESRREGYLWQIPYKTVAWSFHQETKSLPFASVRIYLF